MRHQTMLKKIFLYKFFDDCVWFYPCIAILLAHNGLNPGMIAVFFALWSVASFSGGIFAPIWFSKHGRQATLIKLQAIKLFCFGLWLLVPHNLVFCLAILCFGVQTSVTNIALKMKLTDVFADEEPHHLSSYLGRLSFVSSMAMVISGVAASVFFELGFEFLMISTLGFWVIALVCLKDLKSGNSTYCPAYPIKSLIRLPKRLMALALVPAFTFSLLASFGEMYPLILSEAGVEMSLIGYCLALLTLAEAFGALIFATWKHFEWIGLISGMVLFLGSPYFPKLMAVVFITLAIAMIQAAIVRMDALAQWESSVFERSRVAAIREMGAELMVIPLLLVFGQILNHFGINLLSLVISVFLAVFVLILALSKRFLYRSPALHCDPIRNHALPSDHRGFLSSYNRKMLWLGLCYPSPLERKMVPD
ncbi:MAG: hypothetical protein H3C47_10825 [Candidatus Cloacimonetes bacterium]|nr:hypothetical protein [Candidatus Cloacimonadota bacterium]